MTTDGSKPEQQLEPAPSLKRAAAEGAAGAEQQADAKALRRDKPPSFKVMGHLVMAMKRFSSECLAPAGARGAAIPGAGLATSAARARRRPHCLQQGLVKHLARADGRCTPPNTAAALPPRAPLLFSSLTSATLAACPRRLDQPHLHLRQEDGLHHQQRQPPGAWR